MTRTKTRAVVSQLPGQVSLLGPETRTLTIQLAGLTHDYRYFNALRAAKRGALKAITLRREPENEADGNAIHVRAYLRDNERLDLGYVPARVAATLAPLMDAGVYVRADVGSYRAWRPDRGREDVVVAQLTLSYEEGVVAR